MKTVSNIQKNTSTPLAYCSSRFSTFFIVISLCFLININNVYAVQVTLGWDQNNEPDIAGYKIYYGASSGNYTQSKDVQDKDATSCTITNLIEGQTYYFAATTYNNSLVESDYSLEISYNSNPAATTTTIRPTTTTTVQSTTSSSTSSIIPTTSVPTTTTTVQPTTSSSTSSIIPTTTIRVTTSTTTSAPPPECVVDADCDDRVFCNGTEKCLNSTCVNGQNPCGEEQVCHEEFKQCLPILRVFARCIPQRVLRPWLRDTRCFWLLVYCPIGSHVNSQSTIMITGPETQATGVKVNEQRQLVIMARMLWVPVCIEQGATTGQWNLLIKTDVGDSAFEESIITSIDVR